MPPLQATPRLPRPGTAFCHRQATAAPARAAVRTQALPRKATSTSTSSAAAAASPARAVRTHAQAPKKKAAAAAKDKQVQYGASWYEATRNSMGGRTVAQEIARRKQANWEANGRKRDREDLYTADRGGSWEGSEFVGSANNVLTWILVAAVAAPLAGLAFAYWSYGTLWG